MPCSTSSIDIRVGSPTFGSWDSVRLDDQDRRAIYLAEGLGHCFVALTDDATVSYLVSDVYRPDREHGINPLDPEVALEFPLDAGRTAAAQPKDTDAPGLLEARDAGLLPTLRRRERVLREPGHVRERDREGHHPRRRIRHPALADHEGASPSS